MNRATILNLIINITFCICFFSVVVSLIDQGSCLGLRGSGLCYLNVSAGDPD